MSEPKCETCRFWTGGNSELGACFRYPPVIVWQTFIPEPGPSHERMFDGVWPNTRDYHWCGEWQAKPDPLPGSPEPGKPEGHE